MKLGFLLGLARAGDRASVLRSTQNSPNAGSVADLSEPTFSDYSGTSIIINLTNSSGLFVPSSSGVQNNQVAPTVGDPYRDIGWADHYLVGDPSNSRPQVYESGLWQFQAVVSKTQGTLPGAVTFRVQFVLYEVTQAGDFVRELGRTDPAGGAVTTATTNGLQYLVQRETTISGFTMGALNRLHVEVYLLHGAGPGNSNSTNATTFTLHLDTPTNPSMITTRPMVTYADPGLLVKTSSTDGPDGVAVAAADAYGDWDGVSATNSTLVYDTTTKYAGTSSIRYTPNVDIFAQGSVRWDSVSRFGQVHAPVHARGYFRFSALPSVTTRFFSIMNYRQSRHSAYIELSASGQLLVYSGEGESLGSLGTMPLNAWFRLELDITDLIQDTGLVAARLYTGAGVGGTTPTATVAPTWRSSVWVPERAIFGPTPVTTTTSSYTFWMDELGWSNQPLAPVVVATVHDGATDLHAPVALTTAPVVTRDTATALNAPAALTAGAIRTQSASVVLDAPATVTTTPVRTAGAGVDLNAPMALTAAGVRTSTAIAALNAAAALTAGPVTFTVQAAAASLNAPVALTAAALRTSTVIASLLAPVALTASPTRGSPIETALLAPIALTTTSTRTTALAADLLAPVTLAASPVRVQAAVASLLAPAALTALAVAGRITAAALLAPAALAAAATRTTAVATTLLAPAALTAGPVVFLLHATAASLLAPAALSTVAVRVAVLAAGLTAPAQLTSAALRTAVAAATLLAPVQLSAGSTRTTAGAVLLLAAAHLTSGVAVGVPLAVSMLAAATLTVSAIMTRLAVLPPDAILVQTGFTGALSNIQEEPTVSDGQWMIGSDNGELRVSFGSPNGTLTTPQKFRVLVRPGA